MRIALVLVVLAVAGTLGAQDTKAPELPADKKVEILGLQKQVLQDEVSMAQLDRQYQSVSADANAANVKLTKLVQDATDAHKPQWSFDASTLTYVAAPPEAKK